MAMRLIERAKSYRRVVASSCKKHPVRWAAGTGTVGLGSVYLIWLFFFAAIGIAETYSRLSNELAAKHPEVDQRNPLDAPTDAVFAERRDDGYVVISSEPKTKNAVPVIRRGSYLILLKPEATAEQVSALLQKYDLKINGGVKEAGILFLQPRTPRKVDGENLLQDETLLRLLANEDIVKEAALDIAMGANALPRETGQFGFDPDGNRHDWSWKASEGDGNWGHKIARLPPVWTIMKRAKSLGRPLATVSVGVVDDGFRDHEDLDLKGDRTFVDGRPCATGSKHGNHVAGIIGAIHGNETGTDGIALTARLTAERVSFSTLAGTDNIETAVSSFAADIITGVHARAASHTDTTVINVSMGYNWKFKEEDLPFDAEKFRQNVLALEKVVTPLMLLYEGDKFDRMLIISAAGNDSRPGSIEHAKNSSPVNRAALEPHNNAEPADGVIVVEASRRDDTRWVMSNAGGHLSAPGVKILSTSAETSDAYSVCDGTSMAAPFVSGVAALLFSYSPEAGREDVKTALISTAMNGPSGVAPRVDALEAILAMDDDALRYLADLTVDGRVDQADLDRFVTHFKLIRDSDGTFSEDLNGDTEVTPHENKWPLIDLNGSGIASNLDSDRRSIKGVMLRDIDVLRLAWTADVADFPSEEEITALLNESSQ